MAAVKTHSNKAKSAEVARAESEEAISLFSLGALFVIQCNTWPCRATNEPDEMGITPDEAERRAIASYGSKDLLDPELTRKRFAAIVARARQELSKYSHPFPATNAHFVPWSRVQEVADKLDSIRAEFDAQTDELISNYDNWKAEWIAAHPEVPRSLYPAKYDLRRRFWLRWFLFKVQGAAKAARVDNVEEEIAKRELKAAQLQTVQQALQAEAKSFAADYIRAFRAEVAGICKTIVDENGHMYANKLQAMKRRIDEFKAMNVFDDAHAEAQLEAMRKQLDGMNQTALKENPPLEAALKEACAKLSAAMTDEAEISKLTGRLKRRVVI